MRRCEKYISRRCGAGMMIPPLLTNPSQPRLLELEGSTFRIALFSFFLSRYIIVYIYQLII